MRINTLLLLTLLTLASCTEENIQEPEGFEYTDVGTPALIVVVDNNDRANQQIEDIAFTSFQFETIAIFSDIFGVPQDSLMGKDLNRILDQYGEPWQIRELQSVASSYYNKIVTLTDESATSHDFIDSLQMLTDEGYSIDVVFALHGSDETISFTDKSYPISSMTNELDRKGIHIRTLYQTNCKSARAIDNWSYMGVAGCNGTQENNYLTIFSPSSFLKAWVSGSTYYDAVQFAYESEITTLKSYNNQLPILDYLTSGDYLSGSTPIITGTNPLITKDMYFKE